MTALWKPFIAILFFLIFAVPTYVLAGSRCCTEKDMRYVNGDVTLAATLVEPKGKGPFPAVVMIQGSGTSGRDNKWSGIIATTLAEKGLAVLWTDKRGSGKSTGDWRTSDFTDLARDALAGVEAIRALPEIRNDMIGVIGLSQGGHVAPLAAAMGKVDFVIDFVGGAVPMEDTLIHELEQTYRQHGADDATIEFLQTMTYASFKYIETGQGWDDYLTIRKAVEANVGPEAVETWPDSKDDWYWTFWRGVYDFDPIPYWKKVIDEKHLPVFVAYGELDEQDNVPVKASVARFRENISSDNLTLHVYQGTGHSLLDMAKMANHEYQLVQPLLDDLDAWISKNLGPKE